MDVGAPEQAWVYHPRTVSPYRYRPLDRSGIGSDLADDAVVAYSLRNPRGLAWSSPTQAAVPPGAYGTDRRGRLCIPVHLLNQLGVRAGERVKIQCENGSGRLTISKLGPLERTSPDAVYTAEPDGNVRLTQTTLDKADLGGAQSYGIDGDDCAITVRRFEED
jgi:bifunctional DNA-binding transcriptional regulator/antitoxin component of YhaV-PrlF toxin-antitoxin module